MSSPSYARICPGCNHRVPLAEPCPRCRPYGTQAQAAAQAVSRAQSQHASDRAKPLDPPQPERRKADAALVARVLSVQLDALIAEYGIAAVLHAAADSLYSYGITASGSERYTSAGHALAIAGAMRDTAITLTPTAVTIR